MKFCITFVLVVTSATFVFAGPGTILREDSTSLAYKVLEVCKQRAISYLHNKVEKDLGLPSEDTLKALKVARAMQYDAEVGLIAKKLTKILKPINSSNVQDYTKVIFEEFRKSLADLGEDYYQSTAIDVLKTK